MKYYKDNQNNVFAYDLNGSQDHLIGDKTVITEEQANTITEKNNQDYIAQFVPLTPSEKLASVGLTVEELKLLLGVA